MEQKQNDKEMENSLPASNAVVVSDRYRNDRFFVWYNDAYRMVLCSKIAWLQADGNYCFIHFKDCTKIIVVHKENERENERYFYYTFYLLLRLVSVYTVYTEKEQSEGRVDCIVETDRYVYIFEFKLDGTAAEALRQIEEKGYARPYMDDPRKLYRIGVSFSSETGTVEEWRVEPEVLGL